jgi:molybdenum cofactor cytidylyltransferase
MSGYTIVLLAAGNSSRMGTPKQLLEYGGRPLLRHAAETALASQAGRLVVVLGARAPELRPALDGLPAEIVENSLWHQGMGTSIRAGILAAARFDPAGAILALADQPLVDLRTYNRLIEARFRASQPIVASQYAGTVGVPALFATEFFPVLAALPPDQGCKGVILGNLGRSLLLPCPEAETDIDTPRDYALVGQAFRPVRRPEGRCKD